MHYAMVKQTENGNFAGSTRGNNVITRYDRVVGNSHAESRPRLLNYSRVDVWRVITLPFVADSVISLGVRLGTALADAPDASLRCFREFYRTLLPSMGPGESDFPRSTIVAREGRRESELEAVGWRHA